jgi:4-hydroxy-3-methylbut-2-enyl diphosphate reductase
VKPSVTVLRASPRGFCAGVVRAIETLEAALERYGAPIYARHAIEHNSVVVESFQQRGVVFVEELNEVPDEAVVIFSAHGVPRHVAAEAWQRGLSVIDATCPLVSKVQSEVKHHVAAGRVVLLIGHSNHPEVLGIAGQVSGSKVYVIPDQETALSLPLDPEGEYGLAMQTTLSIADTAAIERVLRERLMHLHRPAKDDICYATTNRQHAVRVLASRCEGLIILGGHSSSNSHRLLETARGPVVRESC